MKLLPKPKSLCSKHSEAKQYQNVRVGSKERFTAGPCKEMGGSSDSLDALSKALFYEQWGRGMSSLQTSWCQSLCSWGQVIELSLSTKTNVSLCSDKKGQVLKAQLSSSKVLLATRRQILVGGSLGARSPDTVIIAEGAKHPGPRLSGHPTVFHADNHCH